MSLASDLRWKGRRVGIDESVVAARALRLIDNQDQELFRAAIKATLIKSFDLSSAGEDERPRTRPQGVIRVEAQDDRIQRKSIAYPSGLMDEDERKENSSRKEFDFSIYSPLALDSKQESLEIPKSEERRWARGVGRFRSTILTQKGHRFRKSEAGLPSMRRTLQLELKRGGEASVMLHSIKKISKAEVVLLCDVSGSMSDSTSKIVSLCCSLKRAIPKSEIFLFNTVPRRVTYYASKYTPGELALRVSKLDLGLGGGTRIGQSLRHVRKTHGDIFTRKTTVVIYSDGWDVGDISILRAEMRELQRRTNRIIWINPFLDSKGYSVETAGMKTALEYIDLFISPSELLSGKRESGGVGS